MRIDDILDVLIPKDYYGNSNYLSNAYTMIDKLDKKDRTKLEDILIDYLSKEKYPNARIFIIEALEYLKSIKSLSLLYKFFQESNKNIEKLKILSSIYVINRDEKLVTIGIGLFNGLAKGKADNYEHNIISALRFLKKFNTSETENIIKTYSTDANDLIAFNARRLL